MKIRQFRYLLALAFLGVLNIGTSQAQYDEKYRPQFHFSPKVGGSEILMDLFFQKTFTIYSGGAMLFQKTLFIGKSSPTL